MKLSLIQKIKGSYSLILAVTIIQSLLIYFSVSHIKEERKNLTNTIIPIQKLADEVHNNILNEFIVAYKYLIDENNKTLLFKLKDITKKSDSELLELNRKFSYLKSKNRNEGNISAIAAKVSDIRNIETKIVNLVNKKDFTLKDVEKFEPIAQKDSNIVDNNISQMVNTSTKIFVKEENNTNPQIISYS